MNKAKGEVTLGSLCERITVGHVGPMANSYSSSGIPFLRSQDIGEFRISTSNIKFIPPEFDQKLKKSRLKAGDVAIVRTGYPGTAAVVPQDLDGANCADLVILTPGPALDAWFVACLLNSAWGRGHVSGVLVGVAQQHFNVGAARDLKTVFPPLHIQRRIGSIIRAYCDLIEVNRRRISILESMARRLFDEWFVRFRYPGHETVPLVETEVGMVPVGWKLGTVQDVVVLQRGFDLPNTQRSDGPYPVIAATGEHGLHNEFKVRGPGIVTGRSGSLGKVMHISGDFWPLNTTLWGKEYPLGSTYFAYFTVSNLPFGTLNAGAAVPSLNRNHVHLLPQVVPPHDVVTLFDKVVAPMFALKRSLEVTNARLREERDLLLPKLISGEIAVSPAEDTFAEAAE